MNYFKKIILSIFVLFCFTGCSFKSDDMEDINIYTTIYPINYLLDVLYGKHSHIYSIYPLGVDLSSYKLSDRKIKEYSNSDLFVFNSLDEKRDRDYAVKMINNNSKLKVIDVSTGMSYTNDVKELWLNPYNYLMLAENIEAGLSEYINNPYLVEEIKDNFEKLEFDVSKIDADLTELVKNANYNTIVVDSDMFKYLEKYGLKVISLEDNSNYSLNTLEEVKKLIKDNKIKYIYSTNEESNSIVKDLIKNVGGELLVINDMYSVDGNISNSNDNYLTVMKNNISLFEKELYK
ncbi:MAG: zinc ABC transporter substrate-binding protein [Bacilli bacterium]|nr:zinc ABC transporter substrate-binding protein [Bacilli bacterium]